MRDSANNTPYDADDEPIRSDPPPLDEHSLTKYNSLSTKPITHLINKDYLAGKDDGSAILPLRENLNITYGVTYMEAKDHANKSSANVRIGGSDFKDAP